MAELPILPLKTDALLGDTAHLSAEQFGAYCRLLFTMWRHGGRLVDNEAELARISGLSLRRWRVLSETILRPFTRAGGELSQKRLTSTWLDVQELRRKRAHAARSKYGRNLSAHAEQVHSNSTANQNQNQNRVLSSSSENTAPVDNGFAQARQRPLPIPPMVVKRR